MPLLGGLNLLFVELEVHSTRDYLCHVEMKICIIRKTSLYHDPKLRKRFRGLQKTAVVDDEVTSVILPLIARQEVTSINQMLLLHK